MSVDLAFEYVFKWFALTDACPKCQSLNGQEWHDQDLFQNRLWDVIWGDIFDLDAGTPLTHPNCRCQCLVYVNVLSNVVVQTIMRYGNPITIWRSAKTGQFVKQR